MITVYFVTEGPTDQIVLEGLVANWLGDMDFTPRHIQPPSSDYAENIDTNLSTGWKGVRAWCDGGRLKGTAGRDEALRLADCLFIHTDADVAFDPEFSAPSPVVTLPTPSDACELVRSHLTTFFGKELPANVVLCVPAMDLEAWLVSCLHPDIADQYMPIESRPHPGELLVQRAPFRLVRRKNGALKKETHRYENALRHIVLGWPNCAGGTEPRCPEAVRFEADSKRVLRV